MAKRRSPKSTRPASVSEQVGITSDEQRRLAQRMEMIGRLASGLAHDFNNLLTAILGHCDLLLLRLSQEDPTRKAIQEIRDAGNRAAALTRQLLAYSRRQVLQPRVLDLNASVMEMLPMLRPLIGEDIELVPALEPSLGRVKADPSQIEQVVMNLVVNARDSMPRGGRIGIETSNAELDELFARTHVPTQPGRYVMLAVSDTGSGMSEEIRERIFEPFFTTKELGKGTGLGLATVYGIVKQSGGYIWVYSEPDRGSVFKVYLPRVDADVAKDTPTEPFPESLRGTETILIVEDEATVRSLVRELLRMHGYTVLEASNGQEALELASRYGSPIHLLLTDVVMPQLDGWDLAKIITSKHPDMKVIYMSGYTDRGIAREGMLGAGDAYLQKPFTAEVLARKIREVLDGRHGGNEGGSARGAS